jgi:cytoskeletal protein RodZ
MSDQTFHVTGEDVRKIESKESKFHDGKTPKDSDTSALKQILAEQESKQDEIDRVKANLPLPEQPVGGASADLQSADQRTVNVGSGGVNVKLGTHSSDGLREPATAESSVRTDGETWKKETAP